MHMTDSLLLIAFIAMGIVFLFIIAISGVLLIRPWLQCFLSNAPVSLFEILAMRLRGAPVQRICEQRIRASYVGVDLSTQTLEKALRQGADIEAVVDAMCQEKRAGREVQWERLLENELTDAQNTSPSHSGH